MERYGKETLSGKMIDVIHVGAVIEAVVVILIVGNAR